MKFTVFNGSPRGKNSNSSHIIQWLLEGVEKTPGITTEVIYLSRTQGQLTDPESITGSDVLLLVFPLYADSMPGIVKAFIEALQPYRGALGEKKLGFVVHSGFPETHHSRFVEKYLVWLAKDLNANYLGTVISANSEGIRVMPESMTRKKREIFNNLGHKLATDGNFDPQLLQASAGREKLSVPVRLVYRILSNTGVLNFYFNGQLKKNNAYKNRFARPYMD